MCCLSEKRSRHKVGKVKYAVIGSGWRAEFYIRIAKAVPEKFDLTAVLIRDEEKAESLGQ